MLRVGIFQGACVLGDASANVRTMREVVAQAAEQKAAIVVFPELFVTGYALTAQQALELAQTPTGPAFQVVSQACAAAKVVAVYGFPEANTSAPGAAPFNSLNVVDEDGRLVLTYRKANLWGNEKAVFQAGDALAPVVRVQGWNVGVLICYDVEFSECVRVLRANGAQLLLVPTANPEVNVNKLLIPARAMENAVCIAYANHVGGAFCGTSVVCDGRGRVVCGMDASTTGLGVAEVDVQTTRFRVPTNYLADLRPELFRSVYCSSK